MDLKQRITEDMKQAMREQSKQKLQAIRLITAAIKQKEVDERIEMTDAKVLEILDKMIKQRRESVKQYNAANRQDLAAQENFEIEIIQAYMPQALSAEEIDSLVQQAIDAVQAVSAQDIKKVMDILKPKLQGRADLGQVSQQVKAKLNM